MQWIKVASLSLYFLGVFFLCSNIEFNSCLLNSSQSMKKVLLLFIYRIFTVHEDTRCACGTPCPSQTHLMSQGGHCCCHHKVFKPRNMDAKQKQLRAKLLFMDRHTEKQTYNNMPPIIWSRGMIKPFHFNNIMPSLQ